MLDALLLLSLQVSPAAPSPPAGQQARELVIIFLVDNSASLPPLDPLQKRVAALEKMLGFLEGRRHRLVLFGARAEIAVDDVSRYRSDGRWTDFFHAFARAREIAGTYPPGTDLRLVLLTDAILDPNPAEWPDLPPGEDLRAHVVRRLLGLLETMRLPLYVILVGEPQPEETAKGGAEQAPGLVWDMVRAANGAAAAPMAQSLAAFFEDDGLLLRKFVYRVEPHQGLTRIEPVVRRIAAPPRRGVEARILGYVVLPLILLLLLLFGLLVRSFPGPGDLEVVELTREKPVHVAADRLHRTREGSWAAQGLSLVADPRDAAATFTLQTPALDLNGTGLDTRGLDPADRVLLPLALDEVARRLETATESGTREEKIHALNLDYMAKGLPPEEVEKILKCPVSERATIPAIDFVRAKVHLATSPALRRKLTEPRVLAATYGRSAARTEILPGSTLRIGRYGFRAGEIASGGRKDARLVLRYDRVPSLFGLKTLLPDVLQRAFRLRRSRQRLVG